MCFRRVFIRYYKFIILLLVAMNEKRIKYIILTKDKDTPIGVLIHNITDNKCEFIDYDYEITEVKDYDCFVEKASKIKGYKFVHETNAITDNYKTLLNYILTFTFEIGLF